MDGKIFKEWTDGWSDLDRNQMGLSENVGYIPNEIAI